jgi:hypothetical protein
MSGMSKNKKKIHIYKEADNILRKMKLPKFKRAKEEVDFLNSFDSAQILDAREEIFAGAPQSLLKGRRKDPDYIFWLGATR